MQASQPSLGRELGMQRLCCKYCVLPAARLQESTLQKEVFDVRSGPYPVVDLQRNQVRIVSPAEIRFLAEHLELGSCTSIGDVSFTFLQHSYVPLHFQNYQPVGLTFPTYLTL